MPNYVSPGERVRRSEAMREMNDARRAVKAADFAVEVPEVAISRVALPDLEALAPWLLERLRHRFLHLGDRMFIGWLKNCMDSNDFLFVKSPNAVAMAMVVRSPLIPVPDVQEVFVLVRNDALGEGIAIYHEFRRWTERLGARDLLVDLFTDVPKEMIQANLGRLFNRVQPFIRVNQTQ